jgi:hypothetical protein
MMQSRELERVMMRLHLHHFFQQEEVLVKLIFKVLLVLILELMIIALILRLAGK